MMPEYQSFLSGQNLIDFWNQVKWLLFFVAPIVLIFFAVDIIQILVRVIKGQILDESVKSKRDDEDDDYDIYRY
ncbi:hypothetical protein J9303_13865 [Bacillaceae bacterium Marseille-Q3522]|nr:hypothetical protein [Bacillaceae bacterium Marseille-Q3522]